MRLIHMTPSQIQDAVRRNVPVLMAAGVVEYHGPHLPVGTDLLMASAVCDEAEKRCECVVAPQLCYGPTLGWAGTGREGDMDFDPEAFYAFARETLKRIFAMGFRRIYALQFHQGENGLQSLCLRRAAADIVREVVSAWGGAWGREDPGALPEKDIFGVFSVATLDTFSRFPGNGDLELNFAHAGCGETQFILATHPGLVDMGSLDHADPALHKWLGDAEKADAETGRQWFEYCVRGWVRELKGGTDAGK